MNTLLHSSEIRTEADVVFVRQRARQIAGLLEFDTQEQTRIATAVSEIARNAFLYALGGRAQFSTEGSAPERLIVRISDRGQGIPNLPSIMAGNYMSETGLGRGLLGAKKLMDSFRVDTVLGHGTTVELGKALPIHAVKVTPEAVLRINDELGKLAPTSLMEEIRQQNSDLLRAFDELRARQLELDRMYREVADANRRMIDVNSQLEEKADDLERVAGLERKSRAVAEDAVASRDQLIAIVSHDLRSPLSAIVSGASLLQMTPVAGPERGGISMAAQAILRSAERMTLLIADLLDLAQIQAGQLSVELMPQYAEGLIRESLEMLRPIANAKGVNLEGSASVGLEISCDRGRILQVLSNLVGNAIKFTPKGGVILIRAEAAGVDAQFLVRDTGGGIPEEDLPRIFDRFWQAKRNSRSGIGLGLSIVQGLIGAHGGRVWVESKVGAGTTFFFTVPLLQKAA